MNHQIIPIAAKYGTKYDTSKRSLLELPAELRNYIYKCLIPVGKTISIHRDIGSAKLGIQVSGSEPTKVSPTEEELSCELGDNLGDAVSLSLTCRQSYHECAGLLYKSNTFVFGQSAHTSSSVSARLLVAVDFCRSLGFTARFLQKLEIDVYYVGATACGCARIAHRGDRCKSIEVAPLQKLLWGGLVEDCSIKLVKTRPQNLFSRKNQAETDLNVKVLNNVVSCLRRDTAGIRRYERQIESMVIIPSTVLTSIHCLMKMISSKKPGRGPLKLRYRQGAGYRNVPILLEEDSAMELRSVAAFQSTLQGIPPTLRYEIFRRVLVPNARIDFDVNTGRRSQVERGLLDLYWPGQTMGNPRLVFWRENTLAFRLSSLSRDLSADQFRLIEEALCVERKYNGWSYPWFPKAHFKACSFIQLNLAFMVGPDLTLREVKIPIKDLLRFTFGYRGRNIRVTSTLSRKDTPDTVEQSVTFTLDDVQIRVLGLFSHVEGKDLDEVSFEVYMDGLGQAHSLQISQGSDMRLIRIDDSCQLFVIAKTSAENDRREVTSLRAVADFEASHGGTRWSWAEFLREVVTMKLKADRIEQQQQQLLCHARHFGIEETATHQYRKEKVFMPTR